MGVRYIKKPDVHQVPDHRCAKQTVGVKGDGRMAKGRGGGPPSGMITTLCRPMGWPRHTAGLSSCPNTTEDAAARLVCTGWVDFPGRLQ